MIWVCSYDFSANIDQEIILDFLKIINAYFLIDLVVPQPVYMNMNDLAEMKAQKKNSQQFHHMDNQTYNDTSNDPCDDSQDLKTPTAENQQSLIEHKVINC